MAITVEMRTQVSQLYVALFGRAPDGEGLGYWVGQLNAGKSMADVANTMYATAPARAYFPSYMTNGEIIASFYVNVLGRAADAEGLAFWTSKLNAAGATPGSVINEMVNTVANYSGSDPAGLESQALFNNKVNVAQWYGEKNGNVESSSTILAGVTKDPASVDAVKNSGIGGSGQTITLTRFTDTKTGNNFEGYLDYNQYTGNDEQTLTTGDRLTGTAASDDTLFAQQTVGSRPTVEGIETISIAAKAAAPNLDMSDVRGAKKVVNKGSNETAALTFSNINNLVDVAIEATNSDTTVTFAPSVVAGTTDNLKLSVNGVGIPADRANFTTAGIETMAISATGAASVLGNVVAAQLNSVTITGDQNLSIGTKAAATGFTSTLLAKVDASAATGNLFLNASAAGALDQTITTGTGNDTVVISGVTANDNLDLGTGTNRVVLSDAGSNQAAKLTNVQQIEARVANTNINLVNAPSVNLIAIAEMAGVASIANVTSVKSGTTFAYEGEGAANVVGAVNTATFGAVNFNLANATGSTDVVNVTYGNAGSMLGANGVVNIAAITNTGNNVETMNLTFSDLGADDTVNVADIVVGAAGAGLTSALRTLTVTSDSKVNLGTGGANLVDLDDLTTFDASAVKGALVVTLGDLAENASATVKTGGAGNSTVTVNKSATDAAGAGNTTLTVDASAGTGNQTFTVDNKDADLLSPTTANFVFTGGTGADTLTLTSAAGSLNNIAGGKGADIINLTLSLGVDRLVFNLGDSLQGTATDVITGFKTAGVDLIDLRTFGFDAALRGVTVAGAALNGTANEFGAGLLQRAVAVFDNGANSTVYVDVNGDAKLDANDLVISFVGNTGGSAVVNADILWI